MNLAGLSLRDLEYVVAVADEVKLAQTLDARAVLDEIAAALTTCACSR